MKINQARYQDSRRTAAEKSQTMGGQGRPSSRIDGQAQGPSDPSKIRLRCQVPAPAIGLFIAPVQLDTGFVLMESGRRFMTAEPDRVVGQARAEAPDGREGIGEVVQHGVRDENIEPTRRGGDVLQQIGDLYARQPMCEAISAVLEHFSRRVKAGE